MEVTGYGTYSTAAKTKKKMNGAKCVAIRNKYRKGNQRQNRGLS